MVRNADGHKFWMNTRAIANAGLDEKTPDSPGGTIGREADGRPERLLLGLRGRQLG